MDFAEILTSVDTLLIIVFAVQTNETEVIILFTKKYIYFKALFSI